MGYRSDVTIVVAVERIHSQTLWAAYQMDDLVQKEKIYSEWRTVIHGKHAVLFIYEHDWVKWYDDYPDVQAIEKLMHLPSEMNLNYAWRKVRIGEEWNDIEEDMEVGGPDEIMVQELEDHIYDVLNIERRTVLEV